MNMNDFKINSNHKIDSGLKIPEGYFENFSEKMLLKINKPEPKVVSIYKRKTWIFSIAAILVISLSVTLFTKIAVKSSEEKLTLENYITNQSEISQYDLVALLDSKDIEKIKIDFNLEDKNIEEGLTNLSEIENYLTE
ncbi:MAG: hypothetical protein EXR18_04115 [Flavobacteriaceae bacterium]|nr:hypothetical protein [Flavobacteriaceae bacterium]